MTNQNLNQAVREIALKNGADLVGVVRVDDLPEHAESIYKRRLKIATARGSVQKCGTP